jgi:deoxyribodipyrimidine photo-lyase
MMNIFWFRRDLRLTDNTALKMALESGVPVLPIFIFDTDILEELPADDARVTFLHDSIQAIQAALKPFGKSVAVLRGRPVEVLAQLLERFNIQAIFTNRDYEPYALQRDLAVASLCQQHNAGFVTARDHVIFERNEIVKENGEPYVVFTPFSKRWKQNMTPGRTTPQLDPIDFTAFASHDFPMLSLQNIGFERSRVAVLDYDVSQNLIQEYAATRNFPTKMTSRLGPHLRFGTISIRECVSRALVANDPTFLNELIWREFFMQILWHFPHTVTQSFRPAYDGIAWRHDEADFTKWCEGRTGYPIVDAGMRELNATGFMHNRSRMVVASFLCKHLLIDWRRGEAYFAQKLLDYEQASNVGNWQWAAGSGTDAAPYFRIFNPTEQASKFDHDGQYIKKWVPEVDTTDYPEPMVEHKFARVRCLEAYQKALKP